jgi:hypothetical protein
MGLGAEPSIQTCAQGLHLIVRQGRWEATESDEPDYPRHLQNLQAITERETHEHVALKEWQLKLHTAVTPAAGGAVDGQKAFEASA